MNDLTENLFNEVNHLIECQRIVMERVNFLEAKRLEIVHMIQNLIASSYKETRENQINQMEMKVSRKPKTKSRSVTTVYRRKI